MPNAPAPINHGAIMLVSGWAPTRPVRFSLGDRQLTATNCHFISPSFFFLIWRFQSRVSVCPARYLIFDKGNFISWKWKKIKNPQKTKRSATLFQRPKSCFCVARRAHKKIHIKRFYLCRILFLFFKTSRSSRKKKEIFSFVVQAYF